MGNAGSQRQLPVVGRPGDWCNEEVVGVEPFVSAFKSTVVSDLAASNPTALTVLVDSRAKQPPRPGYSVSPSVELMDPVMPQPLTPRRRNEVGNWFRCNHFARPWHRSICGDGSFTQSWSLQDRS